MKKMSFASMVLLLLVACHSNRPTEIVGYDKKELPEAPEYDDTTQWYVTDRNGDVDLFYIISTETGDYTLDDGVLRHHADTYNDSVRGPMYGEMLGVDTLLSGKLNYFSPYYRQCSLQTFTSDSTAQARMLVAQDDVRRAFAYYLEHLNNGRPFILSGFSQGARILLELLKEMDDATYGRMVAAYAIGISIPQEVVDGCPRVVPVSGASDLGVTICYNSVKDAAAARGEKSAIAINPVNWRTDNTPATLVTEPTPLKPVSEQQKDTMTVHLDPNSGLVFVEGYTATDYVLPLIGKEGNYHSREIWLYRQQLQENMTLRAKHFLDKKR